jgi:hypothetical protein
MPDMQLVNMKMDPKAREKKYAESSVAVDAPMYPWGLSITLDEDALELLGLAKLPQVGKPMMLVARVDVTSVSESKNQSEDRGTHKHRSVSLQITDLALAPDEKGDTPAAQDVLYDSKG